MSMNATDSARRACATCRATVDFPDPEPPAIPTMKGFIATARRAHSPRTLAAPSGEKKSSHCHNLVSAHARSLACIDANARIVVARAGGGHCVLHERDVGRQWHGGPG